MTTIKSCANCGNGCIINTYDRHLHTCSRWTPITNKWGEPIQDVEPYQVSWVIKPSGTQI